jgi:biofilm PGA synthesis N-glycosyltransferase PgaC
MSWVFWFAVALIAYPYVGYPLWLWLRLFLRPWPVRRGAAEPEISIVMVVRNEEAILAEKLRNLQELDCPGERRQIVVVSDGSSDATDAILQTAAQSPQVLALCNQLSRGKAAGLNDGIAMAHGDVVVFTDARQEIEKGALRLLTENFADPDVGAASGELMLGDRKGGESGRGMGVYWRIEKQVRQLESNGGSVVGATGAFYAVRRKLLCEIPAGTILDDVLIPMNVARQGFRVIFDPRARAWDLAHLGSEREFARKVRTLTGNYQLLQLAPWLLRKENPLRFEFVSHKLMRLFVPFAMAAALLTSMILPGTLYRLALILQLGFYALSVLGVMQLNRGPLARLADAAFTFVVLHVAAVVAFANFVRGRRPAWTHIAR